MSQSAINGVYAVPLYSRVMPGCEAVNTQLASLIRERAPADPKRGWSNVGGWHSSADLHTWNSPAIQELIAWIKADCLPNVATD